MALSTGLIPTSCPHSFWLRKADSPSSCYRPLISLYPDLTLQSPFIKSSLKSCNLEMSHVPYKDPGLIWGLKGAVVNHRMELPHILGCQRLFMTAERKVCAFPPSVLHWRLHTWGIFLESSSQSLWWSISLFLVVSTLLLSTAGLLTGPQWKLLNMHHSQMSHLMNSQKRNSLVSRAPRSRDRCRRHPPGSLILWTTPPAMVAVTLTFNTRVPAFLFLNFI